MKTIIDISNTKEIQITKGDLPLLVHGVEHSGASLFPITVAAQMHVQGNKLLIFTAYPMAKEEFLEQVGDAGKNVMYLESETDISIAASFQTVIVRSGDERLFLQVLEELPNLTEYIPFIKNVETITEGDIIEYALSRESILAGDVTKSVFADRIMQGDYATRVLFSSLGGTHIEVQKYQAKMISSSGEKIVSIQ